MFEDGLNSREENKINHLLNRFNEMLDSAKYLYFDSHDIEKIIDFYIENSNNQTTVQGGHPNSVMLWKVA